MPPRFFAPICPWVPVQGPNAELPGRRDQFPVTAKKFPVLQRNRERRPRPWSCCANLASGQAKMVKKGQKFAKFPVLFPVFRDFGSRAISTKSWVSRAGHRKSQSDLATPLRFELCLASQQSRCCHEVSQWNASWCEAREARCFRFRKAYF
jgi:hypothetical protein